jgi:hypothetical protein
LPATPQELAMGCTQRLAELLATPRCHLRMVVGNRVNLAAKDWCWGFAQVCLNRQGGAGRSPKGGCKHPLGARSMWRDRAVA